MATWYAETLERKGIGKWVLTEIIRQILQVAETHPLDYLFLEALDEDAKNYYMSLNMGFVELKSGYLALYVDTMRQATHDLP